MSQTTRRLEDLLIDLHETMDLEIKAWLDLTKPEHQAKLAKAIIAIANHGGGYIVVGFDEMAGLPATPSTGRPESLDRYNRDRINGITEKYIDPSVHCDVHHVAAPDGKFYPLIEIPGGHRTPITAKRDGPSGGELRQRAIYVRRPGPKSEEPRSAQELTALFDRCFSNRRDEVTDLIRSILAGTIPNVSGASGAINAPGLTPARLGRWIEESSARRAKLIADLPKDDARALPLGYMLLAYELSRISKEFAGADLVEVLREVTPRYTGWPPWWVPTRSEIAPYLYDGAIECWLGSDGDGRDAAHSDFWRIAPDGLAFLMRGYQEDSPTVQSMGFPPRTTIDVTVPIWRAGEGLLHASALAAAIGDPQTEIKFVAKFTGLSGRSLARISGDHLLLDGSYKCRQNSIVLETTADAASVPDRLPEIVFSLMRPLYELFDFFKLPISLVQDELARMRSRRSL